MKDQIVANCFRTIRLMLQAALPEKIGGQVCIFSRNDMSEPRFLLRCEHFFRMFMLYSGELDMVESVS